MVKHLENLIDQVRIFPNPGKDQIHIDAGGQEIISVKVKDLSGRLVYSHERIKSDKHHFMIDESNGIYLIEVETRTGLSHFKWLKQ